MGGFSRLFIYRPVLALVIAPPDSLRQIGLGRYAPQVEAIQRYWKRYYENASGESFRRLEWKTY